MRIPLIQIALISILTGCVPNTYYDISDPYAYGLRWYDRGRYDLASQYWEPLVEKGDCDAEYWVGVLYYQGQPRPQDNAKAMTLWRKAASGNHPKAQSALGDLYYQNDSVTRHHCINCGIKKDILQAYLWYKLFQKSARYDPEKEYAASMVTAVMSEITADQKAKGEQLVAQWKPNRADCTPRKWW